MLTAKPPNKRVGILLRSQLCINLIKIDLSTSTLPTGMIRGIFGVLGRACCFKMDINNSGSKLLHAKLSLGDQFTVELCC